MSESITAKSGDAQLLFRALTICTCVLLGSCATMHVSAASPTQLTEAQKEVVEQGVANGLRDPDSSEWGPMSAGLSGSRILVCGWVNTRSGDAYTGMQPFYGEINSNRFTLGMLASDASSKTVVATKCSEQATPLPSG